MKNPIQIIDVHISTIKVGDTVNHEGQIKTIGNNNIKHCSFMGVTLFGDSYRLGTLPVKKMVNNLVV